ncbi:hypothetical protein GOBAR_AA02954 [Gossypium barbadense]|uniref:Uncharacterized protein n=1 Tax=Gossypium barbadense TaxID=3634 RepID=A0A2P5YPZ9_GOSBA|nr:hypothetical protein GOBAR_AA02954 [Gossypium barbadense]
MKINKGGAWVFDGGVVSGARACQEGHVKKLQQLRLEILGKGMMNSSTNPSSSWMVIALSCSLGLDSVLLGRLPCGRLEINLASWPI